MCFSLNINVAPRGAFYFFVMSFYNIINELFCNPNSVLFFNGHSNHHFMRHPGFLVTYWAQAFCQHSFPPGLVFICLTAAKLLSLRRHHGRPCGDAATLNVAQQPCHYGHRHLFNDPPWHAASGYTTDYDDFDEDDDERGMAVDCIGHDGGKGSGQMVEKRLLSFAVDA